MENSVGRRIAELRRQKGFTQEELGEKLGLSAQAVSKWENDLSYPDIMVLPELAGILGTTVDALLTGERPPEVQILPESRRKPIDKMMLRLRVLSGEGDKVRINLPLAVLKVALEMGTPGTLNVNGNNLLSGVDPKGLIDMVENGMIGKLLEVESSNGDFVEIWVE